MREPNFVGTIIAGGAIGAVTASFLAVLATWLLAPQMFGDGQYIMIFMGTFPVGWVVGVAIGSALALADKSRANPPGAVACAVVLAVAGFLITPLLGPFVMAFLLMPVGLIIEFFK